MKNIGLKQLLQIALLISVEIILTRFCSIQTPIARIGFGFLPIALTGMLFGAIPAGIAAVVADIIGVILFPSGAFFPGFTLTAFLTGCNYGFFLHGKKISWAVAAIPVVIYTVFLSLGLNTIWLWMITGKGFFAILPTRIVQCIILAPIQIVMIRYMGSKLYLLAPYITSINTKTVKE